MSDLTRFLRPSAYCSWKRDGTLAKSAKNLFVGGSLPVGYAAWVSVNVRYDHAKAKKLAGGKGYIPSPDRTYSERIGVCSDFASLTCAIMRINGYPTRVVIGWLDPGNLYHAWVEVYYDRKWHRCDPTMWATGVSSPGRKYKYRQRCAY